MRSHSIPTDLAVAQVVTRMRVGVECFAITRGPRALVRTSRGFAPGPSLRLPPPGLADGHEFSGALNPISNTANGKEIQAIGVKSVRGRWHERQYLARPAGLSVGEQKVLLKLLTRLAELNAHIGPASAARAEMNVVNVVALHRNTDTSNTARTRKRSVSK